MRANGGYITASGFAMRKEYLDGKLRADPAGGAAAAGGAPPNPLGAMEGGMKTQMIGMVTQFGTMCACWVSRVRGVSGGTSSTSLPSATVWVQTYFMGFLLVRLPFALTERFRQLTQAGSESIERFDNSTTHKPATVPLLCSRRPRTRHFIRVLYEFLHDCVECVRLGWGGGKAPVSSMRLPVLCSGRPSAAGPLSGGRCVALPVVRACGGAPESHCSCPPNPRGGSQATLRSMRAA